MIELLALVTILSALAADATTGRRYPLRDPPELDSDYRARGGILVEMTPERFLQLARPLELDEDAEENIDALMRRMQKGRVLDPPMLEIQGDRVFGHDGRHRANAALRLGMATIPVIVLDVDGRTVTPDRLVGIRKEQRRDPFFASREIP